MFSGSITMLLFVAFFSSEASGSTTLLPPASASTAVANTMMTGIAPSATQEVQQTMAPSMASAEPTSPPVNPTTEPAMKPTCAKITFTGKKAWNASFGEKSSQFYNDSVNMISTVLRGVFNNSKMFYDVKVTEMTFTEKAGHVQVMAKLCLVVKDDGVDIEDMFIAKVKTGYLTDMFAVVANSAEFEAEGVAFKDWKAKEGECTKCNEGGGGEFVIEGTCTPMENCIGLKNTKMSKDCVEYCSAASITVSFLILALGILLSFSFQ